jgi:cell division protein FtsL
MSVWAVATSSLQEALLSRVKSGAETRLPSRAAARRFVPGSPEIYFSKAIDNSRLVKIDDPARKREMRLFMIAAAAVFVLCTVYVWQHFRAIEYGYNIESAKAQLHELSDQNSALRLENASLRDPERIDKLARSRGLEAPRAGQVLQMDATPDTNGPVMARAGVSVVSLSQ